MKIERLETHDRFQHFLESQSKLIFDGANACLNKNPDSLKMQELSHYIYIFAHPRTLGLDEKIQYWNSGKYTRFEDVPEKKLLWQPRLSRPKAQDNSYLFRAKSFTDLLEICWLLPDKNLWGQYTKDNICESDVVEWSIHQFLNKREELEKPYHDDLNEMQVKNIYRAILRSKQEPSVGSSFEFGT